MNVKELITKLQEMPQNTIVKADGCQMCWHKVIDVKFVKKSLLSTDVDVVELVTEED